MRLSRSILATGTLSLFLVFAATGCGDSDTENSDQAAPPRDIGTSSGSDLPGSGEMPASESSDNALLLQWCSANSGRDEASCKCILTAVESALEGADILILSEVAKADLAEGSTEEGIEAEFNEKYGVDRMTALMDRFVSTRTAAEKNCPSSPESDPGPQGT